MVQYWGTGVAPQPVRGDPVAVDDHPVAAEASIARAAAVVVVGVPEPRIIHEDLRPRAPSS